MKNVAVIVCFVVCTGATWASGENPVEARDLIIDVDTGIDDAVALLLALSFARVHAVTVVAGNTNVDNGYKNTLRVLQVAKKMDVPVYRGCRGPIAGRYEPASDHFGGDGMGNVAATYSVGQNANRDETRHAALELIRMAKENKSKYTLVLLGPLTNVALALTLDAKFTSYLKDIYILGGNVEGRGSLSPGAEFNFQMDPEAADILLEKAECNVTIIPKEAVLKAPLTWDQYDNLAKLGTDRSMFFSSITAKIAKDHRSRSPGFRCSDALAMMAVLVPGSIKNSMMSRVDVELSGNFTRGQLVHGWERYMLEYVTKTVRVVRKLNSGMLYGLLEEALRS